MDANLATFMSTASRVVRDRSLRGFLFFYFDLRKTWNAVNHPSIEAFIIRSKWVVLWACWRMINNCCLDIICWGKHCYGGILHGLPDAWQCFPRLAVIRLLDTRAAAERVLSWNGRQWPSRSHYGQPMGKRAFLSLFFWRLQKRLAPLHEIFNVFA